MKKLVSFSCSKVAMTECHFWAVTAAAAFDHIWKVHSKRGSQLL